MSRHKPDPVTAGADATEYVWLLVPHMCPMNQIYIVASAPTVTGSVFMRRDSDYL